MVNWKKWAGGASKCLPSTLPECYCHAEAAQSTGLVYGSQPVWAGKTWTGFLPTVKLPSFNSWCSSCPSLMTILTTFSSSKFHGHQQGFQKLCVHSGVSKQAVLQNELSSSQQDTKAEKHREAHKCLSVQSYACLLESKPFWIQLNLFLNQPAQDCVVTLLIFPSIFGLWYKGSPLLLVSEEENFDSHSLKIFLVSKRPLDLNLAVLLHINMATVLKGAKRTQDKGNSCFVLYFLPSLGLYHRHQQNNQTHTLQEVVCEQIPDYYCMFVMEQCS